MKNLSQERATVPQAPEEEQQKPSLLRNIVELVVIILIALAVAWGLTNYVVKPYEIPSGSMLDTIQLGDKVLSEKVSYYTRDPAQGEIVTFIDPEESDRTLIKRVIAVGGQTVDLKDGVVYVDGQPLDESKYTEGKPSLELEGPANISYPYTVPEGYIWCMGDNRTNSSDSRYFGPVPVKNVTGHAFFTYWPPADFGPLE